MIHMDIAIGIIDMKIIMIICCHGWITIILIGIIGIIGLIIIIIILMQIMVITRWTIITTNTSIITDGTKTENGIIITIYNGNRYGSLLSSWSYYNNNYGNYKW